jgi:hypothetical protein
MGFQIGQTIEGKDFVLKSNNKFQDVSKCSGCDCCDLCEFAEYPSLSSAMEHISDLGLEDAYVIEKSTGHIIEI